MNEKKELSMSERISWALGQATGRQFITALVSTYILIFMTDVFGVPAAAAGVIMTAATGMLSMIQSWVDWQTVQRAAGVLTVRICY